MHYCSNLTALIRRQIDMRKLKHNLEAFTHSFVPWVHTTLCSYLTITSKQLQQLDLYKK